MSDETFPATWATVPIEDCLLPYDNGRRIRQGWSPQCESHPAKTLNDWGVLRTSAIQDGAFVDRENKHLPPPLKPREQLEVKVGDILITCAGPRSRCGVTCLVRKTRPRLLISGKMYELRCDPAICLPDMLELFLREYRTCKRIDEMKTGISDSGLNLTHSRFSTLEVPLPPLNEQKRIVAKIEELFSELEAGEESFRQARRQLGVFRQSLLKQAFEGKLTEKWRQQNPHLLEIPEQLLQRIQDERKARYEELLKEWKAAVKKWEKQSKGGKRPSKPKMPPAPACVSAKELGALRELPSGWMWTFFENVGDLGRGKSKHRPRNAPQLFGGAYPFVQTGEVKAASKVVKEFTQTYSDIGLAQSKLWPKGTLCITIAANIAETAFLGFEACFPDSIVGFVPIRSLVDDEFIELFIRSARSRIEEFAPATAQKNINLTTLENLVVPLCSLPEQQEIVRLLDEQFTVIEQNEREIDAALKRSEALRQSILKKAFSGQLVPQDPSDEPAATLLERIRKARETAAKGLSPKKPPQKSTRKNSASKGIGRA